MAAIMERAAVTQSPVRENRMSVIHDARTGRHAIAAKLGEVASLARVVQRMANVPPARVTMHGTMKARGDEIGDSADELAGMGRVHGDRSGRAVHGDQRKAAMLLAFMCAAASIA